MWRPEIRKGTYKYAPMKVYFCCKTLSNGIRIQESAFKKQKARSPYHIVQRDHRKTIKVIKVLRLKYAPVTGIAKRIVMFHNNRCLLDSHGQYRRSVDLKHFK